MIIHTQDPASPGDKSPTMGEGTEMNLDIGELYTATEKCSGITLNWPAADKNGGLTGLWKGEKMGIIVRALLLRQAGGRNATSLRRGHVLCRVRMSYQEMEVVRRVTTLRPSSSTHCAAGIEAGSGRGRRIAFIILVAVFCGFFSCLAQNFSINSVSLANGVARITFPGNSNSYYFLQGTPSLSKSSAPVAALLGKSGSMVFQPTVSHSNAEFFRVEQFPLSSTNSYDHDGIPDSWKLQYGINPIGPSVANQIAPGQTLTWLQLYQSGLAFLITSVTVSNNMVQIGFPGRSDSYYLLHTSRSAKLALTPINAMLGSAGSLLFQTPASGAPVRTFPSGANSAFQHQRYSWRRNRRRL